MRYSFNILSFASFFAGLAVLYGFLKGVRISYGAAGWCLIVLGVCSYKKSAWQQRVLGLCLLMFSWKLLKMLGPTPSMLHFGSGFVCILPFVLGLTFFVFPEKTVEFDLM